MWQHIALYSNRRTVYKKLKAVGCKEIKKKKKKRNILSLSLTIGGVVTDQFTPCTLALEVQVQALPSRRLSFHPGV